MDRNDIETGTTGASNGAFGGLLARRRKARHMSQLDLALEAEVSSRHVSFVETGRSRPSREMVLRLCGALEMSPREENELLRAAGFTPHHRETPLDAPEMAGMLAALRLILGRHEPFGAVAFDRHWDIVMASPSYAALANDCRFSAGGAAPPPAIVSLALTTPPRLNMLRLLCHPAGHRRHLANWEEVARAVLARAEREIIGLGQSGIRQRALLNEVLDYPGVPRREAKLDRGVPPLVIPVELRDPERGTLRLLSTIATLGTAEDITLRELRIEAFYPADATDASEVSAG